MFIRITDLTPLELRAAIVREPLVVSPDTTVMEAIAQMSGVRSFCQTTKTADSQLDDLQLEARSSCVLVVENEQLVGILTERDVVRLSAGEQPLEHLAIGQVMAHSILTLRESAFTDLFFAINLLQQHHIRHLPILDDQDRLVGLVTHESLRQTYRPIDLLRLRLVSEVMTSEVICATPDSDLLAIAQLMAEHRVSCVMIVEYRGSSIAPLQIPVGIITERDLVQFQALSLSLKTCKAQAVMSTPIFTIKPEESLWTVQQMMDQRLIHRLAVTGKQGELLGIVTQTSLLRAFNPLELYNLAEVLQEKVVKLEEEKIKLLENRNVELERQVEARTVTLKKKAQREKLVAELATQIRSSLSLQTILDTTVEQIRQVLDCDRVNIWQLDADWQTIAVAESTASESSLSLLGERIDDSYFKQDHASIYGLGYVHIVSDIYTVEMTDCHRDLLIRLQMRAKILVPILCSDQLWGLLNVSESQHPRDWQAEEVELLQVLSIQLGIAIQQAITHQKLQEELRERQQTLARLRESEQRYANLAAAAPVGIFRTDAAGNCTYVNERWCEIAGLTPEAAIGEGWQQALHPDDRDAIAVEWDQSIQEHRPFRLEYRFQRPDGSVTYVYGQSVAEKNANEQVIGYVGTITDISDAYRELRLRKQAEQELQQLNQALESKVKERTQELSQVNNLQRAILDSADYSIISTDPTGIIQTFNAAAERMLGYSATEIVGKVTPALLHDPSEVVDRAASLSAELGREIPPGFGVFVAKACQGIVTEEEWTYIRKDGSRFPVLLCVTAIKNVNQQIIGFLGIAKDITERKLLEEKLVCSENKLRSIFESITDIIFTISLEGQELGNIEILPVNNSFINSSYQEIIDTTIDYFLEDYLDNDWLQKIREVVISGQAIQFDYSLPISTDILWFSAVISPINATTVTWVARDITDRKRAEAELQKVSERLALALKSGAIGCWEWDIGQNIILWDDRMYQLYGVTKQSDSRVVYDLWATGLHPDDRISTETLLQQAILGEVEYDTEFRVVHPDGSIHFIQASGVLVRDAQGNPQSIIGINFDISDRKHAELENQQLKERLEFMLSASPAVIFSCKAEGNYGATFVSDNIFNLTGYTPTEFLANSSFWADQIHPEDAPNLVAKLTKLFEQGHYIYEYRFRHQQGHYIWVQDELRLVHNQQGTPSEMVGYIIDISDRKQAEIERQQLIQELSAFKLALDQAAIVAITDAQGVITYVNDRFCEISGYSRDELIGETHRLVHSNYHPHEFFQNLWQTIARGEIWRGEVCNRTKNGDLYWVESTIVPFLDTLGQPFQHLAIRFDITDRKLAEAAIQQENNFRQQILENMAEGLCVCHEVETFPFVRFTVWNQQMQVITGYTLEEINRFGWYQSLYPDPEVQARAIARMNRMRQGENMIAEEWEIQPKDREKRTIAISTSVLLSNNGNNYVLALIQDITARKQIEAKLAESEAKFRRLVEGANDVIWSSDVDGIITYLSPQFKTLFGWDESEWIGKPFQEIVHPDDLPLLDINYQNHLKSGKNSKNSEFRHRHRDGYYIWVRSSATTVKNAQGAVISIQGILSDISDLKQAEIALQASENKFRKVFTSNVVGMMFTDFSGQIIDANDRFLEIIGYTRADLNANRINWPDITPPEHVANDHKAMEHLERYRSIDPWEKEYYRKDGSRVPVLIGVALLTQTDSSCVCVVVDISDRKQYEAQLQQTNQELIRATRLKDEFLANMSHELRTPLNAILGMTEGLQEQVFGTVNEQQIKALQTVERSGSHLLELINDILDVAKIEAGQIELDCIPVSIAHLCQSSITFIKQQALKKRIQLEIQLPLNLPHLLVDERRIRQVLINLLNNAVKFTPAGGSITLKVSCQQDIADPNSADSSPQNYLRIAVIDTGIGIAPADMHKLFQPFIQIDSALNRQYAGTGLGLALVKRIVELHNGKVGLTSEVGVGSCFTIDLPLSAGVSFSPDLPSQPEMGIESSQPEQQASPLILLAEDNEANINTISSYLKAKGYRIILAKNGQSAIDLAQSEHPDLILMDIQMPGMDGLEATKYLRRDPNLVNVPIIALTALAMESDRDRCLAAGANDYMSKPVKLKQLVTTIQQFLTTKK